jgi:hypothetical protein
MSGEALAVYFDRLKRAADTASAAEDAYRRDAVRRIKEHEQERAFAYRRLNLMQAAAAAVAGAKDEAEAMAQGKSAMLREVNWNGASEPQRQVADRFAPVALALWRAGRDAGGAGQAEPPEAALAAFEQWFAESRNGPFLALMEGSTLELPLVEV